jgi:hypothetical protein
MRAWLSVLGAVTCAIVVMAAAPGVAAAQDAAGVRVDPGSPSAKEYAIPLEQARRAADPSAPTTATHQPTQQPVPFGAGLPDPPKAHPTTTPEGGRPSQSGEREPDGSARRAAEARPVPRWLSARTSPESGWSSWLMVGGAGLLVVLGGGFAGFALRRARAG